MKKKTILLVLLCATTIALLPVLLDSKIILNRNNDLQEFFWPILLYEKNQLLESHTFPLWNTLFLSGTPLLPNPQSMLFYFPNLVFLLLPIGTAFIASTFAYAFAGSLGMYLFSRELKISSKGSLAAGIFYLFSPTFYSFVEAGHFGLIAAWAIIPFVFLSTLKINNKPKLTLSLVLAFLMALLYQVHLVTFGITASALLLFLLVLKSKHERKKYLYFFIAAIIGACLVAVILVPQVLWSPETTRNILLSNPDIYPKWNSKTEFFKAILQSSKRSTEKMITLGILPIIIASYGFLKLKKGKTVVAVVTIIILIISMSNVSPIYNLLLKIPTYRLLRVATRFWFLVVIGVSLLIGYGMDQMKSKKVAIITISLAALELLLISTNYLYKPVDKKTYAPATMLQFISEDTDLFRVYCSNHCISQRDVAYYKLETIEGYDTVQQINYYKHAWQLTGYFWNYYTLAIPPFGKNEQDHPIDSKSLGAYNVKYIISSSIVDDENLELVNKFESFYLYLNKQYEPRSNADIVDYSANKIVFDTENVNQLLVANVYSKGWRATNEAGHDLYVQETPISQISIDTKGSHFVTLYYIPNGFKEGLVVSGVCLVFILIALAKIFLNQKSHSYR